MTTGLGAHLASALMTFAVSSSESIGPAFGSSSSSIGAFASRAASVRASCQPLHFHVVWRATYFAGEPGSSSDRQPEAYHMVMNAQQRHVWHPCYGICTSGI